ncbi:MAG: ATP-binding cassette domain-containing protein [Theionarchaea archaeon]|nr:ATP-binding cassette domain-containing protein [Theionarchaea archaeon]
MTREVTLEAYNISRDIDGKRILHNISTTVRPREFIAVIGPSGAGKSTMMKSLNGFVPANSGHVLMNGVDFYANFDEFRTVIGYVPQDDIVHTQITVEKALYYSALLRVPDMKKEDIHKRIYAILQQLEIEKRAEAKIKVLSGGERKRVNIGVELISDPLLLFMDEPTSGLDYGSIIKIMDLCREIADTGKSIFMVSHPLEKFELLNFLCVLTRGGRLACFAPPNDVLDYFGVKKFLEIFLELKKGAPEEWEAKFRGSDLYQRHVVHRLSQPLR